MIKLCSKQYPVIWKSFLQSFTTYIGRSKALTVYLVQKKHRRFDAVNGGLPWESTYLSSEMNPCMWLTVTKCCNQWKRGYMHFDYPGYGMRLTVPILLTGTVNYSGARVGVRGGPKIIVFSSPSSYSVSASGAGLWAMTIVNADVWEYVLLFILSQHWWNISENLMYFTTRIYCNYSKEYKPCHCSPLVLSQWAQHHLSTYNPLLVKAWSLNNVEWKKKSNSTSCFVVWVVH